MTIMNWESHQESRWRIKWKSLSRVWLFATLWTVAPSLLCPWDFSGAESWSGSLFPPPGDLRYPRIEPCISCISCIATLTETSPRLNLGILSALKMRGPGRICPVKLKNCSKPAISVHLLVFPFSNGWISSTLMVCITAILLLYTMC